MVMVAVVIEMDEKEDGWKERTQRAVAVVLEEEQKVGEEGERGGQLQNTKVGDNMRLRNIKSKSFFHS